MVHREWTKFCSSRGRCPTTLPLPTCEHASGDRGACYSGGCWLAEPTRTTRGLVLPSLDLSDGPFWEAMTATTTRVRTNKTALTVGGGVPPGRPRRCQPWPPRRLCGSRLFSDKAAEGILARRGHTARNIAKVAAAHRMLDVVFYVLRDGRARLLNAPTQNNAATAA